MTYYESAKGLVISKARAIQEIRKHQCDANEFLQEVGDKTEYNAQTVLDWLGY